MVVVVVVLEAAAMMLCWSGDTANCYIGRRMYHFAAASTNGERAASPHKGPTRKWPLLLLPPVTLAAAPYSSQPGHNLLHCRSLQPRPLDPAAAAAATSRPG